MKSYGHYFERFLKGALAATLLLSCSKKENTDVPGGSLSLDLGVSVAVYDVYSQLKAADPGDFSVAIYTVAGEPVIQYESASQIPERIDLPTGIYYAEAESRNNLAAAFGNDYYFGASGEFEILAGQNQAVSINCVLANIMVTVVYSQRVLSEFDNYTTTISNAGGSLIFDPDETRAGFFDAGPLNIVVNLYYTESSGTIGVKSLNHIIENAEPGKHYELQVDASVGIGSADLNLTVDESFQTQIVPIEEEENQGPVAFGTLLITEIMFNPAVLSDTEGEYIEVLNNSTEQINLNQVVIVRLNSGNRHTINQDLLLGPGEYAVLARSLSASNNVAYSYGSAITLSNTGEVIQLTNYGTDGTDGSLICAVDYGAVNFITNLNGSSLQLSGDVTTANGMLNGLNWCAGTEIYSTGDLGSPGIANSVCP
jgi:hypothetical protein